MLNLKRRGLWTLVETERLSGIDLVVRVIVIIQSHVLTAPTVASCGVRDDVRYANVDLTTAVGIVQVEVDLLGAR